MGMLILLFAGLWITGCTDMTGLDGMNGKHNPDSTDETEVVALSSGGFHSLELKSDGTVWAWGGNWLGQLGDGTTINSPAPIQVSGLTDVAAIAAGGGHSVALKNDGTVWTWGDNSAGQLGSGTTIDSATPVQVSELTDVTAIAAGGNHTVALKTDGTVWAWGFNALGQLGVETTEECRFGSMDKTCSTTPVQVSGLTDVIAIAAAEDSYYSLALKTDGTVWAWGYNTWGLGTTDDNLSHAQPEQVISLTNVTAIAAGGGHILALKTDGTVWAWGRNDYGQLGNGTMTYSSTPVQVSELIDVTAIAAAGYDHSSLALKADGTVWAWGSNRFGQLGVTTESCEIFVSSGRDGYTYSAFCSTTPVQVSELTDVTAIAAGERHALALKTDGTVWAWGNNEYGQLGVTTTETCGEYFTPCSFTPLQIRSKVPGTFSVSGTVSGLTGTLVIQNNGGDDLTITENGSFTFATELEDLDAYDIGILTQPDGQSCKFTANTGRINATDVADIQINCLDFLTKIVDIAARSAHTVALKTDGTVWVWGDNDAGQLGITTAETCNPFTVPCSSTSLEVSDLTDVATITTGVYRTIALKTDGTVWELRDGTTAPVEEVSDLTDITAVAAGRGYTVILKTDGTVWAWGRNRSGELGNGTTTYSSIPIQVSDLTDVAAITSQGDHILALKADGTVWTWGDNSHGWLGVTTTETCGEYSTPCSSTPMEISGLTDVIAIAAGSSHSIVLKADGTVWAWGSNSAGQLGDKTTIDSPTPIQVSDLADVAAIASRGDHSLALKTDGTIWTWGDNYHGQLGVTTTETCGEYSTPCSSTPMEVSGLTDVIAIAAGSSHSIVLKTDGTVWTWGSNKFGQLGNATTTDSTVPVPVLVMP